jgi:hypothetical protein
MADPYKQAFKAVLRQEIERQKEERRRKRRRAKVRAQRAFWKEVFDY